MTERRSTISNDILDEAIKNNGTARNRNGALKGLQQYETPRNFAHECYLRLIQHLGTMPIRTAYDPQCASGNLLTTTPYGVHRFGVDLDPQFRGDNIHRITGSSPKVIDTIKELFPNHTPHFDVALANPPFGLRWQGTDSSKWTLDHCMQFANAGYLISNADTIEAKEWNRHPWVVDYMKRGGLWSGVDVTAGVIFWKRPESQRKEISYPTLAKVFRDVGQVLKDEQENTVHDHNFWLDHLGRLKTYLSTRVKMRLKLEAKQITDLLALEGNTPMSLAGDFKARKTLAHLVECGFYTIEPTCEQAIRDAVAEAHVAETPIMPVTDFELVAYAEADGTLPCEHNIHGFTAGRRYVVDSVVYKFVDKFTRKKIHLNERTLETFTDDHDCTLTGNERKLQVKDDRGRIHEFIDRPDPETEKLHIQHPERDLWDIFRKPEVKTVVDQHPALIEENDSILSALEALGDFTYKPGQKPYLTRVGCKEHALVAAETGCGKTLFAISIAQLKGAARPLIIAPQGTTRDSVDVETGERDIAQWISEIERFAPWAEVRTFYNPQELEAHRLPDGTLPEGFYITYYECMFRNGAREAAPKTWRNKNLYPLLGKVYQPDMQPSTDPLSGVTTLKDVNGGTDIDWIEGLGECGRCHEQEASRGIKCIARPCLSELIGHEFDMLLLDEAHKCCNLQAQVTDALVRMQPRWRYALTATPIPNIVSNMFSLMGWLCVPGWYRGGQCNAAWPYRREDGGRFCENFLSSERDHTAEDLIARGGNKRKVVKVSPVISSPARLLKLIKPTLAYISKPDCNPDYQRPEVIDVRVGMGKQQGRLYAHYMQLANVPEDRPMQRAALQLTILRSLTAEPLRSDYNRIEKIPVTSGYNPKLQTILSLCRDVFDEGKQVVIVNSRVALTDSIETRLREAGVECSRIDTTVSAKQHAAQAAAFKRGDTRVLLMGIKCAQAYSFDQCDRLIIGSLEYSYGSFEQAKGRVDRLMSKGVRIYCVLCKNSIEETIFDAVATKQDNATICLKGKRVPRNFKPIDEGELLAESFGKFTAAERAKLKDETEALKQWPVLRAEISNAASGINTRQAIA